MELLHHLVEESVNQSVWSYCLHAHCLPDTKLEDENAWELKMMVYCQLMNGAGGGQKIAEIWREHDGGSLV